jgi:hypothetical protein
MHSWRPKVGVWLAWIPPTSDRHLVLPLLGLSGSRPTRAPPLSPPVAELQALAADPVARHIIERTSGLAAKLAGLQVGAGGQAVARVG